MNLPSEAKSLAKYLSKIEDRLTHLKSDDVEKRYQFFSIAMDKCTHFESKLGTTGVSLLNIMESNRLSTGEELYSYLYSELPSNIDGKNEINPMIWDAAKQISEIKDAKCIYQETPSGDVNLSTNQEIHTAFDRLIKACYEAAAKASIK